MCGIAGVASLGAGLGPAEEETARRMLAALRHRGPDGQGLASDPSCVLACARLAILDPSEAAGLPLSDEDDAVRLSYNGEVTNFRELRKELEGAGHKFRSRTDSEVVLHAFAAWGEKALSRFTGMFAFALHDRRARKLYLVRDFYGLRPLFYMESRGRLYFASEIPPLMEADGFDGELDLGALHDYFSLAYIPGASTPFRQVRELPGGHLLEADLDRGSFKVRRYYGLRYDPDPSRSESDTAGRVRSLLLDSLRRNLIADVPVGLTLSGGVDTTSLLALAKELGRSRDLDVFSIRMAEPSFDESRYQRIAVEAVPCVHHTVEVGPREVLENLVPHMAYLGEPSGDGAAIPLFLLAREAKKRVSVLLSGEGGDEVFDAYETYRAYHWRRLYKDWAPSWARRALRAAARRLPASYGKLSPDFLVKRFVEGAEHDIPGSHFYWRHAFSDEEKARLLLRDGHPPTAARFRELYDRLDFADPLDRLSRIDLDLYFIDDLMVKNDRMVMAHSIEARYPYMDRPLVEFASTIPSSLKVRGGQGRRIQKLAMKGSLPPEIFRRKNMGLEMPHSLWFLGPLRETASRYFERRNVLKTGILDPDAVDFFWSQHLARRKDYGRPLWCLLNFLVWFDLFVHDRDYKRHRGAVEGAAG